MKKLLTIILLLCSTVVYAQTEEDYIKVTDYFAVARSSLEHLDVNKTESFINSLPQRFPEDKYAEQCLLHYLKGIIELVKYNNIYEARKNFERYLDLYYRCGYDDGVLGVEYTRDMRLLAQLFESHNNITEAIIYANRAIFVNRTIGKTRDIDSMYIKELSELSNTYSRLCATMQSKTKGEASNCWSDNSKDFLTFSQNILNATPEQIDDNTRRMNEAVGPNKTYTAPNYLEADRNSLQFTYDEVKQADKLYNEISKYISGDNYDFNKIQSKLLEARQLYKRMLPYKYDEYFMVSGALLMSYLSKEQGGASEAFLLIADEDPIPFDYEAMNLPSYNYYLKAISFTLLSVGEIDTYLYNNEIDQWLCEEKLDFSSEYCQIISNKNNYTTCSIVKAQDILTINDFAYWRGNYEYFSLQQANYENTNILLHAGLIQPEYLSTEQSVREEYADNNPEENHNFPDQLASLSKYLRTLQFDKAKYHFEQIKDYIDRMPFPSMYKASLLSFYALITHYNGSDNYIEELNKSNNLVINNIKQDFTTLPSGTREKLYNQYKFVFDINNGLLWLNKSNKAVEHLYNSALFTKGLQLRTSTLIQDAILSSGNTDAINQYNEINHLYQIYYTLDDSTLNNLDLWRMELDLLQKVPFDKTFDEKMQKKWSEVKNSLKKDEAAIEFMRIAYENLNNKDSTFNIYTDYCALLLRNNSKSPELIYLCSEDSLQSLLVRGNIRSDEKYYNNIYSNKRWKACRGDELYNTLWTPIEKHLQGVSTIYYSTDGVLHSLAIHALHDTTNTCISDKYTMNLLSSTGDIQEFKARKSRTPASAVVYGGAHFSVKNSEELIAATEKYNIKQQDNELYAGLQRSGSGSESDGSWGYLPGTLVEAEYVKAKMDSIDVPTRLLTGVEANEESFKAMDRNSPQLLHVATHGFYVSVQESDLISNFMDFLSNAQNLDSVAEAQNKSDAMLRAGLIFAGGNRAWSNKEAIEGVEDGILTGREISSLNLSNTKLLVLAACQSGLGEANDHEGVFGLQRAFKLAGVETIIMTLWRIPDETTAELIHLFYDNWTAGMEKHAAFKKAQKQIREQQPNPYFWAGFVILD